ncbi:MAG: hypothetical protein WAT39_20845 [Planctomycetota bacterium]
MNPISSSVLTLLLAAACGVPRISEQQFLHSLTVDPEGGPVELAVAPGPRGLPATTAGLAFAEQLRHIVAQPEWLAKKRVLIFVHGGLNSLPDGLERTARLVPAIRDGSAGETYPILINWQSGVGSGYQDHLVKYHNGEQKGFWRPVVSPVIALADLGRAIARLPIVYWDQGYAACKRVVAPAQGAAVPDGWHDRVRLDSRAPEWPASVSFWNSVSQLLPGIVRVLTTPVIDTVGFEGYDMLLRRVDTLFFTNDDLRSRTAEPHGAVFELLRQIPVGTEIVLVGHSMGTIVLNELIRRFPEHDFRRIVYLAAACTVKDFMDAVPDYLAHNHGRGGDAKFYNLCLHPAADESEVAAWSLVPNGSLLEWLDAYLLGPRTGLHRTFGKWNNAVRMLPLFGGLDARVRAAIHMKGFTVRGDDYPRTHGSFDEYRFWEPPFWDPCCFEPPARVGQRAAPTP